MESVDLEIHPSLYNRLVALCQRTERPLEAVLDAVICDGMEAPEPPYKRAHLLCKNCGTTVHRYTRAALKPGGVFVFYYGCTDCYRMRRHGETPIVLTAMLEPAAELPRARVVPKPARRQVRVQLWAETESLQ